MIRRRAPARRGAVARQIGTLFFFFWGAACSGAAQEQGPSKSPLFAPESARPDSRFRVVTHEDKPPLALLAREGDPAPALGAAVITNLGPGPTTALAAVIEARLRAAGIPVETRIDRDSFRASVSVEPGVGWPASPSPSRPIHTAATFLTALRDALSTPIAPGAPELARAAERIAALKRHPLAAVEAVPEAECTGRLGLAPRESPLDPLSEAGRLSLEKAREAARAPGHLSFAAAGPAAFCASAQEALESSDGWPHGTPADEPWPAADTTGTFAATDVPRGRARVTVALRTNDPTVTVTAAERLGEARGALRSRLAALPSPFQLTEVLGVARSRGGCLSVTAEAQDDVPGGRDALTSASALAAAIVQKELLAEAQRPADPAGAARAVLSARDPRDAAARAAWWALALAPDDRLDLTTAARRFDASFSGAWTAAAAPVVERRASVEAGQGEMWVLLASPCGAADEGALDAGASALGAIAAAQTAGDAAGLPIEPWILPEGAGVIVHAAAAPREDPTGLARRTASAAARALAGVRLERDAVTSARAAALAQIERATGPHGAAWSGLLGALEPAHPSQLFPLGPFARVAALATAQVAGRWQALANGPLRMAILANDTDAQAATAFAEADHWLAPRPAPRGCEPASAAAIKPGRYEAELPASAELAQAIVAVNVAGRGEPGHELAAVAAELLGGERGLAQAALDRTALPATATARLTGGRKSAAIVIDVRATSDALEDALAEIKALLERLGQHGPEEAAITKAAEKRRRALEEARFDPKNRLIKLWLGETAPAEASASRAALTSFFATSFRESALAIVVAKRR